MEIPFLDLMTPHLQLEEELIAVTRAALRTGRFVGGIEVEQFESEFAEFCGAEHCIAVNSGTDALRFAIMAAGVKPGEIVLTVPNTFIATTEAISQSGAVFDFVDVNEATGNMDPIRLAGYLENHCGFDRSARRIHRASGAPVTAVIPVHLFGQMADMDPILELAARYNLIVLEDACQAHGAEYFSRRLGAWKKAGSMGRAAAFSFYPGKNLGACGEGGAVVTGDPELNAKVRQLRDHGQSRKYHHESEGYNGRLDSIQCAMLRIKLRHLPEWNEQRRRAAARYTELLSETGIVSPYEPPWSRSVYHLYVIRAAFRDDLQKYLESQKIGTGLHYPVPLHRQKPYAERFRNTHFEVAEKAAAEILSLPMFPQLTDSQQRAVADAVNEFCESTTGYRELALA